MLKNLEKFIKPHYLLCLFGVIVIVCALSQYSDKKSVLLSGLDNGNASSAAAVASSSSPSSSVSAAAPLGHNSGPASVSGVSSQQVSNSQSCSQKPVVNPKDLLPNDTNSAWAKLNPSASSDLQNVNLLNAGHLSGINTVGSSLRNANLQLRSDPPCPKNDVGPWQNSTIEQDNLRLPFEIGCSA